MTATLTAITGGIGAGKSVISRILRTMGHEVFDCDTEAKLLMDNDDSIKRRLLEEISPLAVDHDGIIDRRLISDIIFSDKSKLDTLNSIVHSAVKCRLAEWCLTRHGISSRLFVETAILYQSGLDKMVDEVWEVYAPYDTRVKRVIERNNCTESEVVARITSQHFTPTRPHPCTRKIINDGSTAVIPQILTLLQSNS